MNIFAVDNCPEKAARSLSDKHVVKMISESCKMLSLAVRNKWNKEGVPYYIYEGRGYLNHPCSVWARETKNNFAWLTFHTIALIDEYQLRFHTTDKFVRAKKISNYCFNKVLHWGHIVNHIKHTPFTMAIPEKYMTASPVISYRLYYLGEKLFFKNGVPATWRLNKPEWIPNIIE